MDKNSRHLILTLPVLVSFLFLTSSCDSKTGSLLSEKPTPVRVNAKFQMSKPTVIMISIDGFRADYLDLYKPPTLLSWAKNGVRSEGLVPTFPTLTFPNHVSLVTGLRPGNHGIVGNTFYDEKRKKFYSMGDTKSVNDGSWYKGVPLWTAAEKQGMLSATAFWVGSEAKIGGINPTYLKKYDGRVTNDQRVKWVTEWLSLPDTKRPHFINLYFSDVDASGHKFGANTEETKLAVLAIDQSLSQLKTFIEKNKLEIQIIIVSDHGMKTVEKTIDITSVTSTSLSSFKNSGRGALVTFYTDDDSLVDKAYNDLKNISAEFSVYRASEFPAHWSLNDPNRRGDIVVVGDPGVYIGFNNGFSSEIGTSSVATHGWDAKNTAELNGLFIAHGSLFKKALRIPAFENVHLYPLVMDILELESTAQIDGNLEVLKPTLKRRR